ncbi:MAG TPA: dihydrolipoamide acetyltransferase family protein [Streptosporangiaceae bacterium]|nr:dihydrolipoamide acetyltransferase family protein [Streptosporangiaceae bacterium]
MADVFKMPKLGESVTTGTVIRWLLAVGDTVAFDDPLLEVATDKVDSEIPSPYSGIVLEIMVPEGETVAVGAELARIGTPAESSQASPSATTSTPSTPSVTSALSFISAPSVTSVPSVAPTPAGNGRAKLSPIVRKLAARHGIDLGAVPGSGAAGRITREDIEAAIAGADTVSPTMSPAGLSAVPPTGPLASSPASPVAAPRAATPRSAAVSASPPLVAGTRDEVQPLSRMRLAIAERMTESLRTAPHVWTAVEVDLQAVEEVRRQHKERFRREEGTSLTYLAFVSRAVCDALRAFPVINSSLDMAAKTRVLHHYVHLGIAVDLSEQGLVVPVIRDADGLNLRGLARAIRAVADKANAGQAMPDDLAGSTFTITNPGPFGGYASAPIINQPNSAILSVNEVTRRPTAVGDAVAVHYMTILGFSYDHRAFDGVTASRFLARVRDALQDRDWAAELG